MSDSSLESESDLEFDDEYDYELNNMFNRYEEAIKAEKRLIYTTIYDFQLFSLECGLSSARDFLPAVRMVGKFCQHKHISFTNDEWGDVIQSFQKLLEANCGDEIKLWRNIKISFNIDNNKVFQISDGDTIFQFMDYDVLEILRLDKLIFKKLELLNNLKFNIYYYNVLKSSVEVLKKEFNTCFHQIPTHVVINIITSFCSCNASLESYCFLECLHYLSEKVLYDLEKYIDF